MNTTYPQPLVTEMFDKLRNAKYFSKMDLLSGLHQVRMATEDIQKTSFSSPFGTYACIQCYAIGFEECE